jgi:hypothetical protein
MGATRRANGHIGCGNALWPREFASQARSCAQPALGDGDAYGSVDPCEDCGGRESEAGPYPEQSFFMYQAATRERWLPSLFLSAEEMPGGLIAMFRDRDGGCFSWRPRSTGRRT